MLSGCNRYRRLKVCQVHHRHLKTRNIRNANLFSWFWPQILDGGQGKTDYMYITLKTQFTWVLDDTLYWSSITTISAVLTECLSVRYKLSFWEKNASATWQSVMKLLNVFPTNTYYMFFKQGNFKGQSVVAAILSSCMQVIYCTSGFFSYA